MFTYYEQLLGHIYSTAFLAKNNWQSNLLHISSKNTRNIPVSEPQEFFRSALLGRHSFAERKWEAKRPTVVTECCYGWNPVNQLVGRCRQNSCMFIPWCQVHHTSNQQSGQCTRIRPKILVEVMSNAALPRMLSQVSSSTRNRLHWRQLLFAFSSTKVHPRPVPINDKASKRSCLLGNLLKWSDMSHVSLILLLHPFHTRFILAKKKNKNKHGFHVSKHTQWLESNSLEQLQNGTHWRSGIFWLDLWRWSCNFQIIIKSLKQRWKLQHLDVGDILNWLCFWQTLWSSALG